jgi:hypothetical protein
MMIRQLNPAKNPTQTQPKTTPTMMVITNTLKPKKEKGSK